MMNHPMRSLWLLCAILLLAGCASTAQPETPRQALYAAFSQAEAVVNTANRLNANGTITDAEHQEVIGEVSNINDTLIEARTLLEAGDTLSAEDRIDLANQGLVAVRDRLREEQSNE